MLNIRTFFTCAQISKKWQNDYSEHLFFKWIVQKIVIWHIFLRFEPKWKQFWDKAIFTFLLQEKHVRWTLYCFDVKFQRNTLYKLQNFSNIQVKTPVGQITHNGVNGLGFLYSLELFYLTIFILHFPTFCELINSLSLPPLSLLFILFST